MAAIEFGLDTFGDMTLRADGAPSSHAAVVREVVEQGIVADQAGVDFFGIGEHHRDDFAISAPEVALAAIAARTERIRLGSAVTVLSSDDPIRVFQRFSTLDAISNGRAEVILGRGSFTESFPLFGHRLDQYETLFKEKLDLFAKLASERSVSWSGTIRPPLVDQRVYPDLESGTLKTWIGVGGSPQSVVRAARYRLPMLLAIIGGPAARFRPYVELYERAFAEAGETPQPVGMHSPGYVADTDEAARAEFWPHYRVMRDRIGRDRGWPPITKEEFEREIAEGSLYVGAPETVAHKLAGAVKALGIARFQLKYSAGPLPHDRLTRCIALYGERVAPLVRDMLA